MSAKSTVKIELEASKRDVLGHRVSQLRKNGLLPAVLYGKGQEPVSVQVDVKNFHKTLKVAGESTLVYLNVAGQSHPTIIHDVTRDPITDEVLHADFYKVNLSEKIKAHVPVEFIGESPAVKSLGGVFVRNVNELEVEALPTDLPHEISVDISILANLNDKITVSDVQKALGSKVELTAEDKDAIVAMVQEPISEEELQASLEQSTTTVEDVEVIEKKKEEEVPVEGEESAE